MDMLRVAVGGTLLVKLEYVGRTFAKPWALGIGFGMERLRAKHPRHTNSNGKCGHVGPLGMHYSGELTEEIENTFRSCA